MEMSHTEDIFLIPHALWRVNLTFPEVLSQEQAESVMFLLEDLAVAVTLHNKEATDGNDWTVSLTTYGDPDVAAMTARLAENGTPAQIAVEKLPEKDWLSHVHDNFPPVTLGRFFIHGSHYTGELPDGLTPLKIDAATAFGSGEHETTKGCLLAFEKLFEQGHVFTNGLDMGCGSGILAIAMTKIWPGMRVAAVDIDPESIVVTQRHAQMNGVTAITSQAGDGYDTPLAQQQAPYDIVAANILSGPLIEMAPQLNAVLKPGGFCVLSGLLTRQMQDVVHAHQALGLTLEHAIPMGDWQALVLRKKAG